ncbi:hypothetical protein N9S67_01600 [Candidatus Pelagibacter sp.]|nr:hypothetical protein [Candidatus Pelagibacter sp.]
MKFLTFLSFIIFFSNCSLNSDSQYWNENRLNNFKDQKKILNQKKLSKELTNMSSTEYDIYIDELTKKSKYPDINQ